MLNREYVDLIEKLAERTADARVNWKTTSSENEFVVYFADFSVSLRIHSDYQDNEYVTVVLRDKAGKSIDELTIGLEDDLWTTVHALYLAARRKALRIDDALRHIISELSSDRQNIGDEPQVREKNDDDDDLPF